MRDKIRSSFGIISCKDRRLAVELSQDFVDYYYYFITRKYWVSFQKPKFGGHISIASPRHYHDVDWEKAKTYAGKQIDFDYSVDMIHGGRTKGFHMFYLKVFSDEIDEIKNDIGAIDGPKFKGLHISLINSKNNNYKLWWPNTITLKS
jgi:hypothetical protein